MDSTASTELSRLFYLKRSKNMAPDSNFVEQIRAEMKRFDFIAYVSYRVACKLRVIQRATSLLNIDLRTVIDYFEVRSLGVNADIGLMIPTSELAVILDDLYVLQSRKGHSFLNDPSISAWHALTWTIDVFDRSQLGTINLLSIKVGLAIMVFGSVMAKYHYIFAQMKDESGTIDANRLRLWFDNCEHILAWMGEQLQSYNSSIISCLAQGQSQGHVTLQEFLRWTKTNPEILAWMPTLHRLLVAATAKHEAKCTICKTFPIQGFRYRCLKCFNVDLCQECFWIGRTWKNHKVSHPVQEYCLQSKQSEDVRDIMRILKNKMTRGGTSDRFSKAFPLEEEGRGSSQEGVKRQSFVSGELDSHTSQTNYRSRTKNSYDGSYNEEKDSNFNAYLLPSDTGRRRRSVGGKMSSDQTQEVEAIVNSLEINSRLLLEKLDKLQMDKAGNASKAILAERKSLQQTRDLLRARQEILEDHNRALEVQLLKLRMILQQVHDELKGGQFLSP